MTSAFRGRRSARLACTVLLALVAAACGSSASSSPDPATITTLVYQWYGKSDAAICSQLTDRMLQQGWGKSGDAGRQACRAAIAKAKPQKNVVVEQPQVNGNVATVKVDYTQQGSRRADEVRFVVVNGAWLADGITAGLTPTPAPSTSSSTGSATTQGATSQTATTQATTQTSPSTLPDASTGTLVPPPAQFSATMKRAGGSRETGMAVLRGTPDGKTVVVLLMKHAPRGVTQAAEIVHGSCASLGSVAYKLTQVGNGVSNTTLPVALGSFQGPFAAVVHSRGVSSAVASCGDLHRG